MNIDDFEEEFDHVILSRAEDYFERGFVISLEEDDDGEWTATVEGSLDYSVIVRLEGREITYSECDCPYDGGLCKHEGAVFMSIRERLQTENAETIRNIDKYGAERNIEFRKESVGDLLNTLGEDELRKVLSEVLYSDKCLRDEFLMRYGDKGNMIEYARKLIRTCVHDVKRRGYVGYRDAGRATEGAEEVLNNIDHVLKGGDALTAVMLCITVLDETADLIACCDDPDGHCGTVISKAIDRLGESVSRIAETVDEKEAEMIFDMIRDRAFGPLGDFGDWETDLMFSAIPLCRNKTVRKKMEEYLTLPPKSEEISEFSYLYDKRCKQILQLDMIVALDGEAAADSYIERNLENTVIRSRAIEVALKRKEFEKVIELCEDGENGNGSHRGFVEELKHYRFEAYEGNGDKEKQRELAKEFVLNGDFRYYGKLKMLYPKNDWQKELEDILLKTRCETSHPYHGGESIYVKIVVAEGLNEKLLEYCEENVSAITRYSSVLLPLFPEESDKIFTRHIYRSAKGANGRSQYREVCGIIRQYEKSFSKKAADIKNDLAELYKRRPAFMDELKRIR